jgi:hypothetical protein
LWICFRVDGQVYSAFYSWSFAHHSFLQFGFVLVCGFAKLCSWGVFVCLLDLVTTFVVVVWMFVLPLGLITLLVVWLGQVYVPLVFVSFFILIYFSFLFLLKKKKRINLNYLKKKLLQHVKFDCLLKNATHLMFNNVISNRSLSLIEEISNKNIFKCL